MRCVALIFLRDLRFHRRLCNDSSGKLGSKSRSTERHAGVDFARGCGHVRAKAHVELLAALRRRRDSGRSPPGHIASSTLPLCVPRDPAGSACLLHGACRVVKNLTVVCMACVVARQLLIDLRERHRVDRIEERARAAASQQPGLVAHRHHPAPHHVLTLLAPLSAVC